MAKRPLNPNAPKGDTKGVMPFNQSLADAYSAENPLWEPAPTINAQLQNPISAKIPPLDPNAVAASSTTVGPQIAANNTGLADTYTDLGVTFDANGNPVYGGGQYFSGAQNYGIDENGNVIGQGDTRFNPFSEAQMMKVAFDQRKNATLNSYASRGQLYSGAINNAQTSDATNYAQNNNALVRNAEGYYGGLVSKARGARDTTNINNSGLTGQAVSDYATAHAGDPAPNIAAPTDPLGMAKPKAPKPGKPRLGPIGRFNQTFKANLSRGR